MPDENKKQLLALQKRLSGLKNADYKVKLGSILDSDIRDFYIKDRFSFLREKLAAK